jgi:hypothetical protein
MSNTREKVAEVLIASVGLNGCARPSIWQKVAGLEKFPL